ncbi:MAG TPA: S53 family peptidase [Novosphingobium sp.]|nr:S53 family peptidase [Novosphingobium sp.]
MAGRDFRRQGHRATRRVGVAAAGLIMAMAGPGAAHEPVRQEVFGTIVFYHQAVCAHDAPAGTAYCHAHMRTDAQGRTMAGKPAVTSAAPQGLAPADLRSAYRLTANGSSATIVAVVDAYGYANAEADLAVYRAQYGLPACTTANGCFIKLNQAGVAGSYPAGNVGWQQETALDLDIVSAMCPNCKIMLVEATTASFANLAAAVNTAVAKGAKVVSNSYGGSETGSSSYAAAYNHPGIAITVSAGDSGYGAQFPATAPGVIAVGGTSLARAGNSRGWSETVWQGTGSGCSALYAKPAWQTDKLCARRMEVDIAAVGNPYTGAAVYAPNSSGSGSGWQVYGGTSLSAPLIGGIYGALGAGPTAAQKIWGTTSGLNDITSGNNGRCSGTYFCTAGTGYDGPSGMGTPAGSAGF